ncbi:VPLPA-CTERM sorting domain-containing protein [Oceanicoccus sp. KOV_DT_Chl]|uniref:VPLPA-CTERM sorting domain-containing protein n=1 Tax=Oceanicoccus sp. KOV_DT_Chl TaxID=1904639 RepID=UPI000C7D1731|nr:VPLPA-CTERM sorting domain-containing protein [Oceanicoccus sp. KOV_DT_Chl]
MIKKSLSKFVAALAFSSLAAVAHSATVTVSGQIDSASGALASLAPAGTPFTGDFDFDTQLNSAMVLLSGFCFNTDAAGQPPSSATCPVTKSAVPIFAQGETVYTGAVNPPGTVFDQAGTTFDGTSGLLAILAYSPSFGVNIAIDMLFNSDGTGTLTTNAGFLGGATGSLTWNAPSEVPVPAAAWLFGSAVVGLAGVGRRRSTVA